MSTDLVPVASQTMSTFDVMNDCWTLADRIAKTEFVPAALRGKPEAVMAAMLTGHEVGMPPMMSLKQIHVIEGKPTLSAEAMRALVLSQGHDIAFEDVTNTKVTIVGRRAGAARDTTVTWTMDDAKKAGLDGKQNWRKFPRAMLEARATGELCRMIFADVLGGISYVKEELEDGDIFEPAPEEDDAPSGAPATVTRKAAPAKKSAAKKAAAAKKTVGIGEPPLPPLPHELDQGSGEDAETVTKRAQQIAMRAQQHGIDHHFVVEAVTCGQKTSAKAVTAEEGAEVLMAIRDIAAGRRAIVDTEHGRRLADVGTDDEPAEPEVLDDDQADEESDAGSAASDEAEDGALVAGPAPQPPAPPAPPNSPVAPGDDYGTEHEWDGVRWRAYLKSQKVTVTDTLREAQRLAREMGDGTAVPTRLDDISGNPSLASLLRGFVEELVLERDGS